MAGAASRERRRQKRAEAKLGGKRNSVEAGFKERNVKQQKLKPKKPKHLKRKLAECMNEEDAAIIKKQMIEIEEKKRKRVEKFEEEMRKKLGDELVNEEGFKALLAKGSSKELLISVAKGETKWSSEEVNDTNTETTPKIDVSEEGKGLNEVKDEAKTVEKVDVEEKTAKPESDEESLASEAPKIRRRRGRGRKDKKEEDIKLAKLNAESKAQAEKRKIEIKEREKQEAEKLEQEKVAEKEREEARLAKKTSKEDDKRRCIGRKPVTDFLVGQRYNGKIVYIKDFGVFIDIMCHSDAFCHVSRASDEFIESLQDTFSPGDEVNVCVLDVNRSKKRVTVAMQSDSKIAELKALAEERKNEKRRKVEKKKGIFSGKHISFDSHTDNDKTELQVSKSSETNTSKPESEMTHAELKRMRKLARRAERRAQKESTGISA